MTDRVGRADLWTRFAPLILSLGSNRISLREPREEVDRRLQDGARLFPYRVRVVASDAPVRLVLVAAAAGSLRPGDRILEINGNSPDDLLLRFGSLYTGKTPQLRAIAAAAAFSDLLLLHGIPAPFEIRAVSAKGLEHTETVPGSAASEVNPKLRAFPNSLKGACLVQLPHSRLTAAITTGRDCHSK